MKKHDFINELTKALSQVDLQTKSEIIADINEHFAEGAIHGMTEEEICINLGQPSQIAEQVLEEYRANPDGNNQNPWPNSSKVIDSIEDIVGHVGEMVGNIGSDLGKKIDVGVYTNMSDFANNFSNDFRGYTNSNSSTRIKGGYEINIEETIHDVKNLDVTLSFCELIVLPVPEGETPRVIIKGRSRYDQFMIENKKGCLIIKEKHPKIRFEIFRFNVKLKAMVYLPVDFNGEIKATISAGNVSTTNLSGNLDVNTSAGSIHIDGHIGEHARLRSSAGGINITRCGIIDVNAKASAGFVKVEGQGVGNLDLDSSAGEINVRVGKLGGTTKLASSAGTIRLEANEVHGNITAKSSAGGIHMRLPKDVNCRINAKKPSIGSLKNNLVGNPNSPYVLQAVASVGSINLDAL